MRLPPNSGEENLFREGSGHSTVPKWMEEDSSRRSSSRLKLNLVDIISLEPHDHETAGL